MSYLHAFFSKFLERVNQRIKEAREGCSGCETMEDYKEGYLMVWANYMSPCNSIAGLYFEGTCDVSYHGNAQGAQKHPLNFSFCKLSEKLIR